MNGVDMPKPSDYLSARQKNGIPLGADEIYKETWLWLKERNCEKLVNPRLIEAYAQAFARYIQCEEATSTYGLLGKHPTTGGVITSPFVQMSQQYQKSANLIWYEIYDIVKQNCTEVFEDNPNDTMELLLRARRKCMIEKVNPSHPDKVADRIAGAIVDLAYAAEENPKIAVEVLIGHGF